MQAYSNPAREEDPHALPNVEVFYLTSEEAEFCFREADCDIPEAGYFYVFSFPGCLPDSEPVGPFKTADEALRAAREECEE